MAGAAPPLTPKPEACSQGRQSESQALEGRPEATSPVGGSSFQQDKGGRAGQEEQGMEGLHGCEMDAEGLQGQVSQVGP